jgi:acetyltransferase-like isoleucine patch superfamily enzyme
MRLIDYKKLKADPTARISEEAFYYGDGEVIVGYKSRIDHGCIFTGRVTIGSYVHVAPYCLLYGKYGITLDNYAGIGAASILHSEADDYSGRSICSPLVTDAFREPAFGPIRLCRLANLGARCTVLPNVTLHVGAAVGAHSLVKTSCPEWGIFAGVPAKWIRSRERACEGMAAEIEGHAYETV